MRGGGARRISRSLRWTGRRSPRTRRLLATVTGVDRAGGREADGGHRPGTGARPSGRLMRRGCPACEPDAEISSAQGSRSRGCKAALAVIEAEDAAAAAEGARVRRERRPRRPSTVASSRDASRRTRGRRSRARRSITRRRAEAPERACRPRAARQARRGRTRGRMPRCRGRAGSTGQRPRCSGRRSRSPRPRAQPTRTPRAGRRANITDPDSRIMTTKDGWVQGYNAQAIVNPHQIVLACEVSQDPGDVQLYQPMTTTARATRSPPPGSPTEVELDAR